MNKWEASAENNCTVTNVGGFLKEVCFDARKQYYHVCANSNLSYNVQNDKFDIDTDSYKLSSVSYVCDNDPHGYQACGFNTKITRNSEFLCGGYFSNNTEQGVKRFVECDQDCQGHNNESNENKARNPSDSDIRTTVCNDRCDDYKCKDESLCNGHTYGMYCTYIGSTGYLPVSLICNGYKQCDNGEDEKHCDITDNTHTCIQHHSKQRVPIFNYTRCGVFELSSSSTLYPYCDDYLDQTNCTDVNRVGGYCLINGFMSSVSKYVLCDSPLIQEQVTLCDNNQENDCFSPSADCEVHKHKLCDGVIDCNDGSDEGNDNCSRTTVGYFKCHRTFNPDIYMEIPASWILDNQTDCLDGEDEKRSADCLIDGSMSAVSKYIICPLNEKTDSMCDDNLDTECISPYDSTDCVVHKHKLCDGISDCSDGSDELNDICSRTTAGYLKCNRTFNADKYMEIPTSWILDNQADCIGGEDETRNDTWTYCTNQGWNDNVVFGNQRCKDVFLCPGVADAEKINKYVEFDFLCDGVSATSCKVENEVCRISRDFPMIDKSAAIENCSMRDLCRLKEVPKNATCQIKEFEGPSGDVFGTRIMLNVPVSKVNCSRLFGEYYVFLSCMGLCINSSCPLENNILDYNSCPRQFPDRVYTLANNSYLTFVTMSEKGEYENDYFQCENRRCVKYSKVCDLVNDCGDMSDERNCTNHMVCENTINQTDAKKQLISYSQKCDGIFDCFDLSDECNESCGKEILENWFLKFSCWLLGILAVIFNGITVIKVACSVMECKTGGLLYTRVLICLIGLGDFLIGVYLIALSIFDSIIHGKDYCSKQAEWLSGNACSVLGVISTTGSQLSLFAMTSLSLIRMSGIMGSSLTVPARVNKRVLTKTIMIVIAIAVASLTIACIPLVPVFEDYFVQGMFYDPEYKIFIGFPSKIRHIKILKEYYRNMNETISDGITWTDIGHKVDGMFSQNYGTLSRSPVHFYGNDGVCLFKYFVRSDDPRRSRGSLEDENVIDNKGNAMVWIMLGVNFFCFVVIFMSYLMINIKTRQSSRSSGQDENPVRARENREIKIRVAIIIGTDFTCWVPFIIISSLHNVSLIDATKWYVTFAMIALPINSVINPLLYDSTIREFVDRKVRAASAMVLESRLVRFLRQSGLRRNERVADQDYRMVPVETTRVEGVCTEPLDPPGNAAQAELMQGSDNMHEGTFPDIRELEMAPPEDIILQT